ncbi:sodium:proton exchanger [Altererythrobacter halimionae]|uniref:Sodium:proton exchanger n=2 Tax=Alteriqipengyuania halimionae TaxID=1926630 RepID=A0A6I4U4R3_9SPHN|nr:sodium:proton exchanger [Alteriqipengyuania halimionae]
MHESHLMRDGIVLIGFALVFVLLFRRLGLGATLGYLVAGAVVGPHVLGLAGDADEFIGFAEIGIILLLFIVGLELNPDRLWRLRKAIFGVGLLQVVVCGLAVSGVIYLATDYPHAAILALGLPLALSSTAQVLPMLQSGGNLNTPFGERAFSILLFQDLSIIALITIIAALGVSAGGAPDTGPSGWALAGLTLAASAGLVLAGRFVLRPLFGLIGGLQEREMFVVAGLAVVTGAAALMEWLGLSTALGAFIAGVMLADTPYRHELEADIEPFRSILLGLFFLGVGMQLDLGAIADRPLFVGGMALALIVTKAALIFGIARLIGVGWRSALALGLLLSQGGEFAFVLYNQARASNLIDVDTASLFGAIVTLSMVATPFLMRVEQTLRPSADDREREEPHDEGSRALVIGYGRFGQTVAQMLIAAQVKVTLVDQKVDQIDVAERFGSKVYYGDGTRMDILRQAGADKVSLIAFCLDGDKVSAELIESVRRAFPEARILVRAFDRRTVMRLGETKVDYIVRELFESAVAMGREALDRIGMDPEFVDEVEEEYRGRDSKRLAAQTESGDLGARKETIFNQGASNPSRAT